MKLFIPTCTLNFNNIFSSESISPLSFYAKRGFGNKRFYSVPANDIDNVIVLYSKFPRFKVENYDMENYPMVIEIETNDYPKDYFNEMLEKDEVKVFICANTIYLNPFHCFVYFHNYESRQGVLAKAEQSLENKYSKLYSANLLIKQEAKKSLISDLFNQEDENTFLWSPSFMPTDLPEIKYDYKKDTIIDRIKGFIYCYLIGANQSVSDETGKLKSIARNLRNTLSAVINSPDKRPTTVQDNMLLEGIEEFNKIYSSKDEDSIMNRRIVENKLSKNPLGLSIDDCIKFLNYLNLYETFCSKINLKKVYDANELWDCIGFSGAYSFSKAIENMQYAVRKVERADLSSCEKHSIENLIEIDNALNVKIIDKGYNVNFYQNLIQSQIHAEYVEIMNEKGIEEPLALAFNGGIILKSIMGEKWENSQVSSYINSLLNHFQENTPFDLFAISNEVVASFAAFCQKGDDIDRLTEYLIQCGFSNYRLAYGIYGATRGFTSLPKTFTSTLINGDKEYYGNMFLNIYFQLFGLHIEDAEFPASQRANHTIMTESKFGTTIARNISKIEPKQSKHESIINAVAQAVDLEESVQSPRAFMYIADNILSKRSGVYKALEKADFKNDNNVYTEETFKKRIYAIIESSLPTKKEQKKETIEKINQIIQLEGKKQDSQAFLYILDNLLEKTSKAYCEIIKIIENIGTDNNDSLYEGQRPQNTNNQRIRFAPQYKDSIVAFICSQNPGLTESACVQIGKDLAWTFDPQYSGGKSEKELLETFRSVLISGKMEKKSRNGKDMIWKNELYRPLDVEKTIQALKERLQ